MKKQYGLLFILIPLFLSCCGGYGQATSYAYHKDLTLTRDVDIWADSQWQYYNQTVGYNDYLEVNISYTGYCDIDIRLFLKIDLEPWDITREGIEMAHNPSGTLVKTLDVMTANSQNRGYNGWEFVRYFNGAYPEGMTVYVLIFVFEGGGSSAITINSNKVLVEHDPGIGGFLGYIIDNILLVTLAFAGAMVGLVLVMNHFRKKYKRYIADQKDKMAKEKLGHQAAKY